ncbi:NAD(P)-dependent oxidoreductase [Actinoplanes sp. N902-109]|uniref:NAD(P)-dependent oxidoreductase n=1 Tax=Actinoplanes sp. (strain N902-109) TaxID=649831 RepID=UPI00032962BC|nr:NAD(P)H-binding protein [Actinoplanes sp. N902-109]AGL17001.1 NAD-dependent epimerase/dehydratase [Actinoplanes sp. N902-109]
MSRIIVLGGTGYAGSAIVAEAAARGHDVTAFSRSLPADPVPGVNYVQGDAADEAALLAVVAGADVVVGSLAPRGPLKTTFRDVYGTIARLADAEGAALYVVGGFSSLRPAAGAPRFVTDLSHAPAAFHDEIVAAAALVTDDLPATPETLDWVFVSPAGGFGAHQPGRRLGHYRVGTDVAVQPQGGGEISGADYALGFVDLIEKGEHHRAHVNLAY